MNDITNAPAYIQSLLEEPRVPGEALPFSQAAPDSAEAVEVEHPFPDEVLDPDAVKVVRRLVDKGHEAYLVGGCVRDLLFGLQPKDFDLATSAQPNEVRQLFRNCRIIGRRFRLAHIYFRDKVLEVATFRAAAREETESDESGELLIREDNVFGNRGQDALRRDFTVNALLYDVKRGVIIDHAGGVADAEAKVIRSIGDPDIRVQEDPIRMLRAVRLAARVGATIDPATWAAIVKHREKLLDAAAPRILEDILRMFRGGAIAPAFDLMLESGMLQVVLGELHDHLAARAREGDTEEVEALRAVLRQADRHTRAGRELGTPVQLATLLAPLVLTPADHEGRGSPAEKATRRMRPIATRLSLARKDGERIRQILLTLPKMAPPPPSSRRRRGSSVLLKRSYFEDALHLFEIHTEAMGDFREEAARWRERYAETQGADAGSAAEKGGESAGGESKRRPRRRSSRRRGGRRRRS